MRPNILYILPPDGIPPGETAERFVPLTGTFAIKTTKGGLERPLAIVESDGLWGFYLEGFLVAPKNKIWVEAAGWMGEKVMLLGRRLTIEEYQRLIKVRRADIERGIDLSAAVDINSVELPDFSKGK